MDPGSQSSGHIGWELPSADHWLLFSSPPRFMCGMGVKSAQAWWSSIVGQRTRWLFGCWTRSCKSAVKQRKCGWRSCRVPFPRRPLRSREARRQPTGLSPGTLTFQRGLCGRTWALKVMWVARYGVVGCFVMGKECGSPTCLVVKILDKWDTERGHPLELVSFLPFISLVRLRAVFSSLYA